MQPTKGYASFAVKNNAVASRFYRDILGLTTESMMDGYVIDLGLPGGARVMVYEKADHEPANFTVLNLEVANLEETADELIAKGVEMARFEGIKQDDRGIAHDMGPTIAWIRDTSGNIIGLLQADPAASGSREPAGASTSR
jgi:predicted enzyme related to lactoylglutathione lyase